MRTALSRLAAAAAVPVVLALGAVLGGGAAVGQGDLPAGLRAAIDRLVPGVEPDSAVPAAVPGLYEVSFGPTVIYVSEDGRYMVRGDLIDLRAEENLTERRRRTGRLAALESLGEDTMIVFSPEDPAKVKYTVTVFTDVDCPYCARFHKQMAQYNELGIRVRYLAFPRTGIPSQTYETMRSVWCAGDRHEAMTRAKAGLDVAEARCENPIQAHFDAGKVVGVRGTPTMVLPDGTMVPGYLPPEELAATLAGRAAGG